MPSKLRPSKGSTAKKVIGGALSLASNFVPGGGIAKSIVGGIASKIGQSKGATARPKKKKSITSLYKQMAREKVKAKLVKIKLSPYKGM